MYVERIVFTDGSFIEGHFFVSKSEHYLFKDYIAIYDNNFNKPFSEVLYRIDTIAEVYVSSEQSEPIPFGNEAKENKLDLIKRKGNKNVR